MNLKKNENSFFLNIVVNLLNDRYKFKLYLRHFELHISIQNPQTTQTKMLSGLSGSRANVLSCLWTPCECVCDTAS